MLLFLSAAETGVSWDLRLAPGSLSMVGLVASWTSTDSRLVFFNSERGRAGEVRGELPGTAGRRFVFIFEGCEESVKSRASVGRLGMLLLKCGFAGLVGARYRDVAVV